MSDSLRENAAKPPTSPDLMLRRIAEALGQPATAFLDGTPLASDIAEQSELLRIWASLTNRADRRRVLDFARSVASELSKSPCP